MAKKNQQTSRKPKRARQTRSASVATELEGPAHESEQGQNAAKTGAILRYMREMPLDVLLEIFSHLEPADLIHLSRTTKALRSIMMVRSSRSIWTQALASIPNLPPCPDDLIEAQYANLMFTDYCHECLINADDDPDLLLLMFMEARTQLCYNCAPRMFKPSGAFSGSFSKVQSFVPFTREDFKTSDKVGKDRKYHVGIANQLVAEYDKLAPGGVEKGRWFQEQTAKYKELSQHAEACETFFQARLEQCERLIDSIRIQRQEQVIQRLKALGLTEEVCYPEVKHNLKNLDIISGRYIKVISAEEWDEIESELLEWVEEQRVKHHFNERVDYVDKQIKKWLIPTYARFIAARSPQEQKIHPNLLEISSLEEVRTTLEDTPLNQNPSPQVTEALMAKLPQFVDEWRQDHDDRLLYLVKRAHPSKDSAISREVLFYATTSFECESCDAKGLVYPKVLTHPCNYHPSTSATVTKAKKRKRNSKETPGTFIKRVLGRAVPLSTSRIRFSEAGYLHAVQVLNLLGLARDTTSIDLKSKAPPLECLCFCYEGPSKPRVPVMQWPNLLADVRLHRKSKASAYENCYKVSEREVRPVRVTPIFICPVCTATETLHVSWGHFKSRHGITNQETVKQLGLLTIYSDV